MDAVNNSNKFTGNYKGFFEHRILTKKSSIYFFWVLVLKYT